MFVLTEDTKIGRTVIKEKGTEIDAQPIFDGTDTAYTVEQVADTSWTVNQPVGRNTYIHKTELIYKTVEVEIEAQDFGIVFEGSENDDEGNPIPEYEFQISAYDRIEWVGTGDTAPAITRIIDLNEKQIAESGGDKLVYGSDEKGVYFDNGPDNKTYITGAEAAEDKVTSGGNIIVGDVIIGTELGEVITGGFGDDIIAGNGGNDTLIGSAGNDVLLGGLGDDVLLDEDQFAVEKIETELFAHQGSGSIIEGELELELAMLTTSSDDVLVGGQGYDQIDGDGGNDFISSGDVSAATIEDVQVANVEDAVVSDVFERVFVYEDEPEAAGALT